MLIYELHTNRGYRFYKTYEGANRAIEEDILDIRGTIISDTRNGEEGKVVAQYDAYWNHDVKEVYEIKLVPLYE